jgi:hypothetical protein
MVARKRADGSRPLPRPFTISDVMTLRTLADVRTLLSHLPKETRAKDTWQVVATALKEAAAGADPTPCPGTQPPTQELTCGPL